MIKRSQQIIDAYPADPLPSRTNPAAKAKADGSEQLLQHSTFGTEYGAKTGMDNARASVFHRFSRSFPFSTEISEKSAALRALFSQLFLASISVKADSGSTQNSFWGAVEAA